MSLDSLRLYWLVAIRCSRLDNCSRQSRVPAVCRGGASEGRWGRFTLAAKENLSLDTNEWEINAWSHIILCQRFVLTLAHWVSSSGVALSSRVQIHDITIKAIGVSWYVIILRFQFIICIIVTVFHYLCPLQSLLSRLVQLLKASSSPIYDTIIIDIIILSYQVWITQCYLSITPHLHLSVVRQGAPQ